MRDNRRHGVGKAALIERLGQHRCPRYLFLDTLYGSAIRVTRDENDRSLACLTEPSSDLDPFSASFQIDIHEDNIGLIVHRKHAGLLSICG